MSVILLVAYPGLGLTKFDVFAACLSKGTKLRVLKYDRGTEFSPQLHLLAC